MGASISCSHFERFSSFLEYRIKLIASAKMVTHYLDDFFFVSSAIENEGQRILDTFMAMCSELGVPLAPEKTMRPSTCITYLGLEIDSMQHLVKVPAEKVKL